MRNIDWQRLRKAIKESFLSTIVLTLIIALFFIPFILTAVTDHAYWLLLYVIGWFVFDILEKYRR